MGHYKSNLRDIEFNLFEVFGVDRSLGTGPFAALDVDSARDVLKEVERLCTHDLAASFAAGDRTPPVFDERDGSVVLPAAFTKSYDTFHEGGWDRFALTEELGGIGAPPSLIWAVAEMVLGANPAVFMYSSGPGFAQILHNNGNAEQKRFAELAIERGWGATMVLTEPDAGSDVGAGRATARQQSDGTWRASSASSPRPSGTGPRTSSTSCSRAPSASPARAVPVPRACRCSSSRRSRSTSRPVSSASATGSTSPTSRRRWA